MSIFKLDGRATEAPHLRLVVSDGELVPLPNWVKAEPSRIPIVVAPKKACAAIYWCGKDSARQIDECLQRSTSLGVPTIAIFGDENGSGSTTRGRPSFQAMRRAARGGGITHLIVADLDRLSRNLRELLDFHAFLRHQGIALHEANSDAPLDVATVGLRAMLNAQRDMPPPNAS